MTHKDKIKSLGELATIVELQKKYGKSIVTTNGCFDIFHYGHLQCLEEAKSMGDILVVGVNSDSSVKQLKNKNRPLLTEEERMGTIAGLSCVDYVFLFNDLNPERFLRMLQPDIHVKGYDYEDRTDTVEYQLKDELNLQLRYTRKYGNAKSTDIVRRILEVYDKV